MKLKFKLVKANSVYEIRLADGSFFEQRLSIRGATSLINSLCLGNQKTVKIERLNKKEIQYLRENCLLKIRK